METISKRRKIIDKLHIVKDSQFRRGGRRRRTKIRHKIRNGRVGLMPDRGDNRRFRIKDCFRDRFLIERP